MRRILVSVAAGCVIFLSSSLVLAADNWLGTWKLNVAKSKYSPGPAPKGRTLMITSSDEGTKLASDTINADAKETHAEYVSKFDGTNVAWTGNPDADTSTAKRIDDNHFVNNWMKDGKTTVKAKVAISSDGKTMTISQTGMNGKGKAVHNVEVYDRQ
jgi:hypothetical protein